MSQKRINRKREHLQKDAIKVVLINNNVYEEFKIKETKI